VVKAVDESIPGAATMDRALVDDAKNTLGDGAGREDDAE
jgi:hypothetical protein